MYGIIRVEKIKACDNGALFGRAKHNLREDREPYNIDPSKSKDNLIAGAKSSRAIFEALRARHNLVDGNIRKDAVGCLEVMVTFTKDSLNKKAALSYFKDASAFIKGMYGQDNVLNMTIHFDEETPHLHAFVVPMVKVAHKNNANGELKNRLSCQNIMGNKKTLRAFQDDFYQKVSKKYGLKRGEFVENTKAVHSRPTLVNKVTELEKDKKEIAKEVEKLKREHKHLHKSIGVLATQKQKHVQNLVSKDNLKRFLDIYNNMLDSNNFDDTLRKANEAFRYLLFPGYDDRAFKRALELRKEEVKAMQKNENKMAQKPIRRR